MPKRAIDRRTTRRVTASALFTLAGLHVVWGLGSSFPFENRDELADAVIGRSEVPPISECLTVAAALAFSAALVAGVGPLPRSLRTLALRIVTTVFLIRGVVGALGRTAMLSPGSDSPRFTRMDQRIYSPLCLWLAAGVRRSI